MCMCIYIYTILYHYIPLFTIIHHIIPLYTFVYVSEQKEEWPLKIRKPKKTNTKSKVFNDSASAASTLALSVHDTAANREKSMVRSLS